MREINRFRTAIARTSQSKPYQKMLKSALLNKNHMILDYGCGKGFDFTELKKQGFNIVGFDKFNPQYNDTSLLNGYYDVVVCNYVFNVIEDIEERKEVLNDLMRLGNKVIISVRADKKAIKDNWEVFGDGYITPNKTFQKFYTEDDVKEFFGNVEFLSNSASEKIFILNK